jgi:ATP-dependent Clp protease ATP-binding subunit ClpC
VDFKNTIIIMTSNIGSRQLKDFGEGVGFATQARRTSKTDFAKGVIENALKKTFAPEFLNRIDDVVIFNALEKEHIFKIIDIELQQLYDRIHALGYSIEFARKAKDFIVEKGWDSQFGARPIKRAIQKYVEDALAEELIKSKISDGDHILIDHEGGDKEEVKIIIKKPKASKPAASKQDKQSK